MSNTIESQLLTIISSLKELSDDTSNNVTQVTQLTVLVNSLLVRLDSIEQIITTNTTAPKRIIKTSSSNQIDENESSNNITQQQLINIENQSKKTVMNTMSFFKKYIIFKNLNGLREKYAPSEVIEANKSAASKKQEGSEQYWTAIGAAIWKTLSDKQKKELGIEFKTWNSSQTTNIQQLNEDND